MIEKKYLVFCGQLSLMKQCNAFYRIMGGRHNGRGEGVAEAPRSVLMGIY